MTTALIFGIVGKLWPFILAGIGAIGVLFWGRKKEKIGAAKERAKQAAAEAKARDIADEIDDAVAGREPTKNRKELGTWSRD